MSVNVTVHENSNCSNLRRNIFLDRETARKQELEKRRRLRLEQVRQQSKEVASKIRKSVCNEKKRALKEIERTKNIELNQWRQKQCKDIRKEYEACLLGFGEAHRAAEQQKELEKCKQKLEKRNQELAKTRGALAEIKVGKTYDNKKRMEHIRNPPPNSYKHSTLDKENLTKQTNPKRAAPDHTYPKVIIASAAVESSSSSTSSDTSTETICEENNKTRSEKNLTKTPTVILQVDSESDSSSLEIEDQYSNANMQFSRISRKKSSVEEKNLGEFYDPKNFVAPNTSSESQNTESLEGPYFTQISELVRKRRETETVKSSSKSVPLSPRKKSLERTPVTMSTKTTLSPRKVYPESLPSRNPGTVSSSRPILSNLSRPTLKSSQQPTILSGQNQKVQFYDYNNKFQKTYTQKDIVARNEPKEFQLSAMEQARLANEEEIERQKSLEELRKKSDERSQRALEREQIRKDYANLTMKLDTINKEKSAIREEINPKFCDDRINQQIHDKQKKMNDILEKILNGPVIITCPEVKESSAKNQLKSSIRQQPSSINVDAQLDNVNSSSFNSSDSCASFLMNFVENKSQKIKNDIDNCCGNSGKIEKLKELLDRINKMQQLLLKEIEKYTKNGDESGLKNLVNSIGSLEQERVEIMDDQNDILAKRETILTKREKILEKKLKELYVKEKEIKKQTKPNKDEDVKTINANLVVDDRDEFSKPVQIVINLKKQSNKSPRTYKSPRKRCSLIDLQKPKKKSLQERARKRSKSKEKSAQTEVIEDKPATPQSTVSTSYQSPPEFLHTALGELLRRKKQATEVQKIDSKLMEQKKPLNPQLVGYIKRLLGMSRTSIEHLAVSSSEIETPSTSILNTSGNVSSTRNQDDLKRTQMERLNRFIEDNYSFLNEVEESMGSEKFNSSSNDSSLKFVEQIWLQKLKRKETDMKKAEKPLKPILKLGKEPKLKIKSSGHSSTKDSGKLDLANKYTELTDSCAQRIAELNEMINKVRKEKQKILEITLSSGNETGRNSTEYMDFASERHQATKKTESSNESERKSQVPTLEERESSEKGPLEKNKLTGVSRDSGISLSRPVTALDVRDSPDFRLDEKHPGEQLNQAMFIPILKGISKTQPKLSPLALHPLVQEIKITDIVEKSKKPGKPPASMTRYSPQLVEEPPHELSMILEVETPGTSRLNTSVKDHIDEQKKLQELSAKKFPTFEEYARQYNLDITQFDPETSSRWDSLLSKSIEIKEFEYRKFSSPDSLKSSTNTEKGIPFLLSESLKQKSLKYHKFPSHKDYAQEAGISDLLDSQSIDAVSLTDTAASKLHKVDSNSSDESLPDIVAELKKRNMLKNSINFTETVAEPEDNKLDEDNDSDDIIPDLKKMGIKWAVQMLQKSRQMAADNESTSTSSFGFVPKLKSPAKKKSVKLAGSEKSQNETSDTSSSGVPLNLKDFLTKEFNKHTRNSSSTGSSSIDDSLASQFLRSLLNSVNSSSSANETPKQGSASKSNGQQERQRTSTPVLTRSTSSEKVIDNNTTNLFSAESRMSSVKLSSHGSRTSSAQESDNQ